jgi:NAD(P)-dependent dehydrogenase (short-subunit alcohol dehydrogenase family)
MKRTLPSFSLEGRVAVVTGGARGLGLVMGQALIQSGADLAIVDLNSQSSPRSSIRAIRNLLTVIQRRKASTKPKS